MQKVSIITVHNCKVVNGSTVRPKWQINALEKVGFKDAKMIDSFTKLKLNDVKNSLVHAHQFSGRLLENEKFFVDIHGLEYIQSKNLSKGFPITSWKKYGYIAKSIFYKRVETKLFKNAVHLICSSEDIQEKVQKIQNSTLIRNAVFVDEFMPTENTTLKIALVGPFLPGTINYEGLDIISKIVTRFPKIKFVFIGKTNQFFRSQLNNKNTEFLGVVNDYKNTLRKCSVLFAPYPNYARYLGSKNKFLEAAACKMPIITTSAGAVDFRNDLLSIGDTIEEISNLIEVLMDENTRKEIGRKLRNEIEKKYNAIIEINKLVKLYNEYG
ncbi:glycosyltransferase family 4 protein [Candidatus Nitrosarchaeum limnium]|uniref:Toxin secretion/phage lysis holin n=1 Tax=Candidatus Nitrosarchaeum limnium BG20 TaxID=859192 RepID=S2ESE6_9ARCH|nr:glycosyltransferase family 4 protein [Candidatus Nitrosarchaeum limnium]EPA05319.1 toxin secretion/phage lysis holin [Candidatus Nitrosarchaeum limnium BG20]